MDTPIEEAIRIAGSEAKLGEGTGFSQVAINKAKHKGRASPEMALAIHHFTRGAVPASSIRPDIWARPEDVPAAPSDSPPTVPADQRAAS
jgi:DNA-binding transcriptional regulator YdaS (Cro superfamily)